jgi:acyl carrier protein
MQTELARLAGLPEGQLPSPDAGFFDLGLDSVTVVSLGAILERELGLRPEPTLMFEYPTLSKLAVHLAANLPLKGVASPPVNRDRGGEPVSETGKSGDPAAALADEVAALRRLLKADDTQGAAPGAAAPGNGHAHYTDGDKV